MQAPFVQNPLHDERLLNKMGHCRFCAQETKIENLLDLSGDHEALNEYITMLKYLNVDFINLSNTRLPKTSCEACYRSLKAAYNFLSKIKQSQVVLDRLYNVNVKKEPVDSLIIKLEPEFEMSIDFENRPEEVSPSLEVTQVNVVKKSPKRRLSPKKGEKQLKKSPQTKLSKDKTRKHLLRSKKDIKPQASLRNSLDSDNEPTDYASSSSSGPEPATYCGVCIFKTEGQETAKTANKSLEKSPTTNPLLLPNSTAIIDDKPSDNSNTSSLSELDSMTDFAPTYCGMSVFESDIPEDQKQSDDSWTSYHWACRHCNIEFEIMAEIRDHSKELHGMCYGFDCVDCDEQFNTFNSFVEHVRQHRDALRFYCQHCNLKFPTRAECESHALTHWGGAQKICDWCGEVCPDVDALTRHKRAYKQVTLPRRDYRKRPKQVTPGFTYNGIPVFEQAEVRSWIDYEWTCQECYIRASDVNSLRAHIRSLHDKCFAMKCADCLKVVRDYRMFVKHVTGHRPYLKIHCQYCNLRIEDPTLLAQHIDEHLTGPQKPCDGCGQIFEDNSQLLKHLKQYDPPRRKGTLTTEDLTCDVCSRLFKNMGRLRTHKKTHDENRSRDHICDTCGKAFFSIGVLEAHVQTHSQVKSEVCEMCKKEFSTKQKLRCHVLTHLEVKLFTCDECGKNFRTKDRLKSHIVSHGDVKAFKCLVCDKEFKFKTNMKTHMNIHTGLRPYSCEHCERTFTNWANCNKHMIRKHGVTLAKTKLTSQGRIAINKETGKVKKLQSDRKAKEWMSQVIKPQKRGKKTAK